MIPVTKPFLPPREEYEILLDGVWKRDWLTNNGQLVRHLKDELMEYLKVPHLEYVSSGTMALQIAIEVLDLTGEIITTPFSFVATTSSIVWQGCRPVFVDIDPDTLNIDPDLIEDAITAKTSAIIATHVFGNPCDIEAIQEIANEYNLKVIYDAAHCFGTKYRGKSVYHYGDISTASFHATKLFHTVEGGAVITSDRELSKRVRRMRNFGHAGPGDFEGLGINGKNSEFHAAMGLLNLKYTKEILGKRKEQCKLYEYLLIDEDLQSQHIQKNTEWNHSYFPIILDSEDTTLRIKAVLEENDIYPRRYFYPSLDELEYVENQEAPTANDIAKRILCLPLYHDLRNEEIDKICGIILGEKNIQKPLNSYVNDGKVKVAES